MTRVINCQVCKVREAVAGVYCQFCLDRETEDMSSEELAAASAVWDQLTRR